LRTALDVNQGAPASPVARIKLLMDQLHEQALEDIHLVQRAFAVRLCSPPPPPPQAKRRLFGIFTELVQDAQACGEIRSDVDAELVGDLLRMVFFRRMIAYHTGGHPSQEHDFGDTLDLLMDGLAGPNWRQP
jgi:hypothetical protein